MVTEHAWLHTHARLDGHPHKTLAPGQVHGLPIGAGAAENACDALRLHAHARVPQQAPQGGAVSGVPAEPGKDVAEEGELEEDAGHHALHTLLATRQPYSVPHRICLEHHAPCTDPFQLQVTCSPRQQCQHCEEEQQTLTCAWEADEGRVQDASHGEAGVRELHAQVVLGGVHKGVWRGDEARAEPPPPGVKQAPVTEGRPGLQCAASFSRTMTSAATSRPPCIGQHPGCAGEEHAWPGGMKHAATITVRYVKAAAFWYTMARNSDRRIVYGNRRAALQRHRTEVSGA